MAYYLTTGLHPWNDDAIYDPRYVTWLEIMLENIMMPPDKAGNISHIRQRY